MSTSFEHPGRLLRRVGISDVPAGIATAIIVLLQYVFVLKLWEGYVFRFIGDHIHGNVAVTGLTLSFAGAVLIIGLSLKRWHRGAYAARQLERPATHPSFKPIADALLRLTTRSELVSAPALLYTPKNAIALEVRQNRAHPHGAIVVGLHQRARQAKHEAAFDAQLGHELSHLEWHTTAREGAVRRSFALHTRVLIWSVAVLGLTLGFVDPLGFPSDPPYFGFSPIFSSGVYIGLLPQLVVVVFSWLIALIYTQFYLVRREHLHDVRGSQLAGNDALALQVFDPLSERSRWFDPLVDFVSLHPTPGQRAAIVRRRDIILMSVVLYPLVMTGLQPLILLLLAGWRSVFGVEILWWHLGLTVFSGCLLYLLLAADLRRLAIGALLRRKTILWQIPTYAGFAAVATQLPRIVLEFVYGIRNGNLINDIVTRTWAGLVSGGQNIIVSTFLLLVTTTYLYGVRLSVAGEARTCVNRGVEHVVGVLVVIGGFVSMSLTTTVFRVQALTGIVALALLVALVTSVRARCPACHTRRWSALWLQSRCSCGHDTVPMLRAIESNDYAGQSFANPTTAG